ncbi:hypothetical protein V2J09_022354 [Rumex salicifolius]
MVSPSPPRAPDCHRPTPRSTNYRVPLHFRRSGFTPVLDSFGTAFVVVFTMAKLELMSRLYSNLQGRFADMEVHPAKSLFKLLKLPNADVLKSLVSIVCCHYNKDTDFFQFGDVKLGITLEDILCITGLPIMGKPVVCRLGRKEPFDVFQDVMSDIANQTTAFFLIRIPKLRKIFKIKLGLGDEEESDNDENDGERDGVPQVPLLQSVVEKVKDISFNHKFDYKNEVELCFNNLTENCWGVVLKPYNRDWLPAELLAQLDFVTYLGPIFCLNDVVLHRPHFVAKQFGCLEAVDFGENFSNLCWADYTIVLKQNKGPWEIDLEGWYEDDLKRWRDGNFVLDCLPLRMWPTDLHQSNQTSSINDSPESFTPELSNALSFSVPSTRSFSTTSSSSRSPTPPTPSPILGKGMRRKKPIDRLTYSAPKKANVVCDNTTMEDETGDVTKKKNGPNKEAENVQFDLGTRQQTHAPDEIVDFAGDAMDEILIVGVAIEDAIQKAAVDISTRNQKGRKKNESSTVPKVMLGLDGKDDFVTPYHRVTKRDVKLPTSVKSPFVQRFIDPLKNNTKEQAEFDKYIYEGADDDY